MKTITITEDAYEVVKGMKKEGESFSELFKRIGEKKLKVSDLPGILNYSEKDMEDLRKRVDDVRKNSKGMEERINYVRSRLKLNN